MVAATLTLGSVAAGENCQVWQPLAYRRDQTRRVVVWCHGAGATFALGPTEKSIAAAGFPLIATDLGGQQTWGSDVAQQRIADAWAYAKANMGVRPDKMILWGGSMGSANAMIYALDHPADVAAIGVALPIMDPEDVRANDRGGYKTAIEAVYGAGAAVPGAKRPATRAGALAVPSHLWVSDDDPIGQPSIADAFIAAAPGAGKTSMGAHGHTYTSIDVEGLLQWLLPYRGDL